MIKICDRVRVKPATASWHKTSKKLGVVLSLNGCTAPTDPDGGLWYVKFDDASVQLFFGDRLEVIHAP